MRLGFGGGFRWIHPRRVGVVGHPQPSAPKTINFGPMWIPTRRTDRPTALDSAVMSTGMVMNMTEKTGPAIDRSIYPMPMFINLVVSDLAASETLYAQAGFVTLATIPGPGGIPSLVHLRREKYQDILMTQGAPARGTASASFAAGDVDLVGVADRLRAAGAEVAGPTDTLWFTCSPVRSVGSARKSSGSTRSADQRVA